MVPFDCYFSVFFIVNCEQLLGSLDDQLLQNKRPFESANARGAALVEENNWNERIDRRGHRTNFCGVHNDHT
jgi:hypothetical protein